MDDETRGKLTEQQHQIDRLSDKLEAGMEIMESRHKEARAENESAIDRLQLSNEKSIGGLQLTTEKAIGGLRTDMERLRTTIFIQMIGVATLVVAAVGVLIGYLEYFK